MTFDNKETIILNHYRHVLEECIFDEYDILGFLIFIRGHITESQYPYIKDFSHLVAHRGRDRGRIMNCIEGAIVNQYQIEPASKTVIGYCGMSYKNWENEWITLGLDCHISFSNTTILEILICVFSLSQNTKYKSKAGHAGKIELFQGVDNFLYLTTTEGKSNSYYICFSKIGPFDFITKFDVGRIEEPVETVRIDGKLRLKSASGFII